MSATVIVVAPGERKDLRIAFQRARRNSVFGIWEECHPEREEEKDIYDDSADYVLAINEQEKILFGLRVIKKTEAVPLPIEKYLFDRSVVAIGSVEFSRALRIRHARSMDAVAVYQRLFEIYGTAPGAYASVRESYLKNSQETFGKCAKRLLGKVFRIDGEVFVHVAFQAESARAAFSSADNMAQYLVA